jgi:NAD(P)-dependent dehydrogenase (short-subunit alcohol dehydrogenase family)
MTSATKYSSKLVNQRVLIFGGTSGIGFCVAEAAIENGAHLILSSSNTAKLEKAVARLRKAYPSQAAQRPITTQTCDLSDTENLDANLANLFQAASNNGASKINHVVFTAGDALDFPELVDLTPDLIQKSGVVRFVAPLMIAKYIRQYTVYGSDNDQLLHVDGRPARPQACSWMELSFWVGCGHRGSCERSSAGPQAVAC